MYLEKSMKFDRGIELVGEEKFYHMIELYVRTHTVLWKNTIME